MKKLLLLISLLILFVNGFPQKTLLVEKIGTNQKYYFHEGNFFKIRKVNNDSVLKGNLWSIRTNAITIYNGRFLDIPVSDIHFVYKRYNFLTASAATFATASIYYFIVISINHIINNEPVMSPDVWIISGACLAAATICFSFSERRCHIDNRWKIKILDADIRK